jgi:ribonucleoside-diphosphate reductase subunit M2
VGKENMKVTSPVHNEATKPVLEKPKAEQKPAVAPTIRPEEADEPLLQENPHRFVLFPIKYHEVRVCIPTRHA